MEEKDEKTSEPAVAGEHLMKPPEPPAGVTGGALFSRSGPVTLGAEERGVVTLGGIRSRTPASHLGTGPAPQPTVAPPPLASRPIPTQAIEAEVDTGSLVLESGATSWSPTAWRPRIDRSAYVHRMAAVIGNVTISPGVFVAAGAVIRGENEETIFIGERTTIQEGVVIRDLPTRSDGDVDRKRLVEVGGREYTVYIGKGVTLAAQSQVHGPAHVGDGVYLAMQSLVFWARLDEGVVVEPGCLIMNVSIPSGVFVPAGLKVTSQKVVEDLPPLTKKYRFYGIGAEAAAESEEMLSGYRTLLR